MALPSLADALLGFMRHPNGRTRVRSHQKHAEVSHVCVHDSTRDYYVERGLINKLPRNGFNASANIFSWIIDESALSLFGEYLNDA
jgi:hypothetical protein